MEGAATAALDELNTYNRRKRITIAINNALFVE
jgi:hypothetical protein